MLLPQPQKVTKMQGCYTMPFVPVINGDFAIAKILQDGIWQILSTKAQVAAQSPDIRLDLDRNMESEQYRLEIAQDHITVIGGDRAGIFYGVCTLKQYIKEYGALLPCAVIEDYPTLKIRGYYLDVTRGKVPTMDTLKSIVDQLSKYKINHLQLYTEHTFAFAGQSEVWMGVDPITPQDILELDRYCQERFIELVPSIATFGHLYNLLVTKSHRQLNEYEDAQPGRAYFVNKQMHHTIDVSNPNSFSLVKDMIDQTLPLFSSDKFNICCDETFDLGMGRNKHLAEAEGKENLYMEFLLEIVHYVQSKGKQVMFWGDVALHHPQLLPKLPKDLVFLNWNYEPQVDEIKAQTIAQHRLSQIACSGVMGHQTFANRLDVAYQNIDCWTHFANKYQMLGLLNTDWGDFGHSAPFVLSKIGMMYGACAAWNHVTSGETFNREISLIEYSDSTKELVPAIFDAVKDPVVYWMQVNFVVENYFGNLSEREKEHYWYDHHFNLAYLQPNEQQYKGKYDQIMKSVSKIRSIGVDADKNQELFDICVALRGAALIHAVGLVIKKHLGKQVDTTLIMEPQELAQGFEVYYQSFADSWRETNRESELWRMKESIFALCSMLRDFGG